MGLLSESNIFFQYQGDEKLDTDIPTYLEAKLFCTTFGKFVWLFLQPLFYALRPVFVYPKSPTNLELINVAIQVVFDAFVYFYFGEYSYYINVHSTLLIHLQLKIFNIGLALNISKKNNLSIVYESIYIFVDWGKTFHS